MLLSTSPCSPSYILLHVEMLRVQTTTSLARRGCAAVCCTAKTRNISTSSISPIARTASRSLAVSSRSLFVPTLKQSFSRASAQIVAMATASDAQKKVLVPIANGSEEMEAVIVIDVLRRAGANVVVASVEDSLVVNCSRGVKIAADTLITEAVNDTYDLVALPGGMPGAERLRDCSALEQLVKQQAAAGRMYAAICATPAVFFESKGMLEGKTATAHPAFAGKLSNQSAVDSRVVVDGLLTTSRGPGTAFEFALSLVKQLYGEQKMKEVAGPMVMYDFQV